MLGAQVGDDLRHVLIGERIGERRHLLAAIENLIRHFGRSPNLVLADIRQGRGLFAAFEGGPVAVGATLVAVENGSGHLVLMVVGACESRKGKSGYEGKQEYNGGAECASDRNLHGFYFRIAGRRTLDLAVEGLRSNLGWMASADYPYASQLRIELGLRSRLYARGRAHVESYGNPPVIVYEPEYPTDEDLSVGFQACSARHGNFFDRAYMVIAGRPEWMRRFDKVHTQGTRSLPRSVLAPGRRWRELDSSMSSDALLMNVFCTPGVAESAAVQAMLGVEDFAPEFGWRARVPLRNGRFDRTEVDMRLGGLLVEAKLTESDFQTCKAAVAESYRDFDEVFDADLLPRIALAMRRSREAVEFPEDYSQEGESLVDLTEARGANLPAPPPPVGLLLEAEKVEAAYQSYQLIRNVLAAHAQVSSFCVIHDERRPDLREAWFEVMAAVRSTALRVRLKVLTWQELAAALPADLQDFLDVKYGIVRPGRVASSLEGAERFE